VTAQVVYVTGLENGGFTFGGWIHNPPINDSGLIR